MKSHNRIILVFLVILLVVTLAFTSGCTSKQDKGIADMMKVVPPYTSSLSVFKYEDVSRVPALLELWNNLAGELLPEDITPYLMAISAQSGILSSLLFSFDKPTSLGRLFPADVYTDRTFYKQTEVVRLENGLDAFMYNNMLIVVMMDGAEAFLDNAADPTSSMYTRAVFKPVIDASLEGAMVFMTETANVTGLPVVMGVSVNTDNAAALKIEAVIDYGNQEKAAAVETTIETYLSNIWALETIKTKLHDTRYEIKAELAPDNVKKFMDGITREF